MDSAQQLMFESLYVPSVISLVLMCVIVFFASIVQACLGMGYGLTAAPLLALVDPAFVPVATLLVGLITSSMGAWSERSNIIWPEAKHAVLGRLLGALVAAWVLSSIVDKSAFMVVFGIGVGAAVVLSVFNFTLDKSPLSLTSMGAVSGLMGTITGVGAPPLALVYQGSYAGNARPTLAAIFAIGCLSSAVILATIGWLGIAEIALCVMMLPPMMAGTVAGRRTRKLVDRRYRLALLTTSAIAAVILVLKGWLG